jgi:hypothetical protein
MLLPTRYVLLNRNDPTPRLEYSLEVTQVLPSVQNKRSMKTEMVEEGGFYPRIVESTQDPS